MNEDADPQEPEAEPPPTAGDAERDTPPSERAAPPSEPEPDRAPLWTVFLLPISVLVSAAVIVAAILAADARSAPADSVTPALTDLTTAVGSLSAEVLALSEEVESLSAEVELLAMEVELSAALDQTQVDPSGPRTLRQALDGYAASLDLDAARFDECLADDATFDAIRAQLQRGIDLGVNGTPTFFVNNKMISGAQPAALFAVLIDAELAGSPTRIEDYPDEYREVFRQLADRDPPGFAILLEHPDGSGAPIEGSPDAPVMIVEFSDFQCPFCQRWYVDTLPEIRALVGDDVAITFLHFPLTRIHANAAMAHAAAECAGSQGKFWEMHDLLFERQGEWSSLPDVN
ncbi:MAG: thioredoxin domain-containing protein [Chloroflexi bacterium]|nr:thioredoxin domain-containing protein [Chloroflexota bacterium]